MCVRWFHVWGGGVMCVGACKCECDSYAHVHACVCVHVETVTAPRTPPPCEMHWLHKVTASPLPSTRPPPEMHWLQKVSARIHDGVSC